MVKVEQTRKFVASRPSRIAVVFKIAAVLTTPYGRCIILEMLWLDLPHSNGDGAEFESEEAC